MDQLTIKARVKAIFEKYKFVLLIVAVGLTLMILPSSKPAVRNEESNLPQSTHTNDPETSLENILSQIDGAGRVEVMLTVSRGEKTVYQTDSDLTENDSSHDTVIVTGTDRLQSGLVTQVISPVYQGAIIVCDGADDPTVRLYIVEAVSRSTGLGADHISVLKMK